MPSQSKLDWGSSAEEEEAPAAKKRTAANKGKPKDLNHNQQKWSKVGKWAKQLVLQEMSPVHYNVIVTDKLESSDLDLLVYKASGQKPHHKPPAKKPEDLHKIMRAEHERRGSPLDGTSPEMVIETVKAELAGSNNNKKNHKSKKHKKEKKKEEKPKAKNAEKEIKYSVHKNSFNKWYLSDGQNSAWCPPGGPWDVYENDAGRTYISDGKRSEWCTEVLPEPSEIADEAEASLDSEESDSSEITESSEHDKPKPPEPGASSASSSGKKAKPPAPDEKPSAPDAKPRQPRAPDEPSAKAKAPPPSPAPVPKAKAPPSSAPAQADASLYELLLEERDKFREDMNNLRAFEHGGYEVEESRKSELRFQVFNYITNINFLLSTIGKKQWGGQVTSLLVKCSGYVDEDRFHDNLQEALGLIESPTWQNQLNQLANISEPEPKKCKTESAGSSPAEPSFPGVPKVTFKMAEGHESIKKVPDTAESSGSFAKPPLTAGLKSAIRPPTSQVRNPIEVPPKKSYEEQLKSWQDDMDAYSKAFGDNVEIFYEESVNRQYAQWVPSDQSVWLPGGAIDYDLFVPTDGNPPYFYSTNGACDAAWARPLFEAAEIDWTWKPPVKPVEKPILSIMNQSASPKLSTNRRKGKPPVAPPIDLKVPVLEEVPAPEKTAKPTFDSMSAADLLKQFTPDQILAMMQADRPDDGKSAKKAKLQEDDKHEDGPATHSGENSPGQQKDVPDGQNDEAAKEEEPPTKLEKPPVPKTVPEKPKTPPAQPKKPPAQDAPAEPKAPQAQPKDPPAQPKNVPAQPKDPQAQPKEPPAAPEKPKNAPEKPKDAPAQPKEPPAQPKGSEKPKDAPAHPKPAAQPTGHDDPTNESQKKEEASKKEVLPKTHAIAKAVPQPPPAPP